MKNCKELQELQEHTDQDHIDMISQPDCWPNKFLPLTRYKNGSNRAEYAVILSSHVFAGFYSVKIGNMFALPDCYDDYMLLDGYKYNDIEEIVLDGWVVD